MGGSPGTHNFPSASDPPPPPPINPLEEVVFDGDARVLIPSQSSDLNFSGHDWNDLGFDDQSAPGWFNRTFGVGFDTLGTSDVGPLLDPAGDIQTEMFDVNPSAFVRSAFTIDNASLLNEMRLNVEYDDGFIAFLNGVIVARGNAPTGTPSFDAISASGANEPISLPYDATTQASGTNFPSHFAFGSSTGSFGSPAPYGISNNTSNSGWIWNPGGYLDVDFGGPQGISSFRAYSVYASDKRGATFVVEHSDDGTNFSSTDGGSFSFITTSGVGVDDAGNPEMAGNGYAGWYQFDFNS